jgi:hypothetical protein
MKKVMSIALTAMAVLGTAGALMFSFAPTDAQAQARGGAARGHASAVRGHSHSYSRGARVGVFVGAPIIASPWWYHPYPYYYGYAPYYYPPTVYVQEQPTVYVEQQAPVPPPLSAPQAQPEPYWYYCQDSKTYYPYVQKCATPWQRVMPYATQ